CGQLGLKPEDVVHPGLLGGWGCRSHQSQGGHRMMLHGSAELSLNARRRLVGRVVEEGWTLTKAAAAAEVSVRTARKWVRRFEAEGEPGLLDRSSCPKSSPTATPEERVQ